MGDVSVIARRLSDKYVQNGWSGNGGYFATVGARLLTYYNTPDMVEYLFSLGQLETLAAPYSERTNQWFRTNPIGEPHYVDRSELGMFDHIAFVDYGYLYDSDNRWYYIKPGPFAIKIPLEMVAGNLDERGYEFDFLRHVQLAVATHIRDHWYREDDRFRAHLEAHAVREDTLDALLRDWQDDESYWYEIYAKYKAVYQFFDEWIVIRPGEDGKSIGEIVLRPWDGKHTETILW